MTNFIEYTDTVANSKTVLNVSLICAVIQDPNGKACIILNDKDNTKLFAVEPYEVIRKRLIFQDFPELIDLNMEDI